MKVSLGLKIGSGAASPFKNVTIQLSSCHRKCPFSKPTRPPLCLAPSFLGEQATRSVAKTKSCTDKPPRQPPFPGAPTELQPHGVGGRREQAVTCTQRGMPRLGMGDQARTHHSRAIPAGHSLSATGTLPSAASWHWSTSGLPPPGSQVPAPLADSSGTHGAPLLS